MLSTSFGSPPTSCPGPRFGRAGTRPNREIIRPCYGRAFCISSKSAGRQLSRLRLGHSLRRIVIWPSFQPTLDRASRLHGHVALDRFSRGTRSRLAHESHLAGSFDTGDSYRSPGVSRRRRRGFSDYLRPLQPHHRHGSSHSSRRSSISTAAVGLALELGSPRRYQLKTHGHDHTERRNAD